MNTYKALNCVPADLPVRYAVCPVASTLRVSTVAHVWPVVCKGCSYISSFVGEVLSAVASAYRRAFAMTAFDEIKPKQGWT